MQNHFNDNESLDQIDTIYKMLRVKLHRGSGNSDISPYVKGVKERIDFIDNAYVKILNHLKAKGLALINTKNAELGNFIIRFVS